MHEPRAVLLSGEHETLPAAELQALLDVHDPAARMEARGLVATVHPGKRQGTDTGLGRMTLAHEWGILWAEAEDSRQGILELAEHVRARADGVGTAAVATQRRGHGKSRSTAAIERTLGAALKENGHGIDLENPQRVLFAWMVDKRIVIGERRGVLDRGAHEARGSDERPHFSPIALHPRRAASLLHLARAPPGGKVYDPFCGTGTFVLEAALEGYEAFGSDIDPFMVQGTLQTLADAGPAPLDGTVFQADVADAPALVGPVDAIVTDLPYGRASGAHGEELAALYGRALAAFRGVLPPGGRAVVGHSDPALLGDVRSHGFRVAEEHAERAHRSLTRRFAVVIRD